MNKIEYLDDCHRIQSTLMANWKIEASLSECQGLWRRWSRDEYSSHWISVPREQMELTSALEAAVNNLQWFWEGPYQIFEGNA